MPGAGTARPPLYDGGAAHLRPGIKLPDVALPATIGDAVNLATRHGAAVVYVYPWTGRPGLADPPGWDDIPGAHGSTPETVGFRDAYARFRDMGFEVFGLSTQSLEHQRELSTRLAVPFAILSDADFALQAALQLPTFAAGGVPYLKRLTLVVEEGRLRQVFYPVPEPGTHAEAVLDRLTAAGP
jgi:peroxiredoxin